MIILKNNISISANLWPNSKSADTAQLDISGHWRRISPGLGILLFKRMFRSLRSFGSHKSPKTREKKRKRTERSFFRTENNVTYRTEKNRVPNPLINSKLNSLA